MILLLFFCSGATALIYEVVWSKYLSLILGSTVQAQTVVLAVFMGGLALGNRIFGGRAGRVPQPLAVYGYIEVVIGLYAFFFAAIYKFADLVFISVGARILEHSGLLLLLKATLSVGMLLGPTILMGGTLPLLAEWLQRDSTDAGRRSARFYSTNSLGAVCGAGLAGFVLVQELGMGATLQLTALANVLIGIVAVALARHQAQSAQPFTDQVAVPAETKTAPVNFMGAILLVTLTGAVSMGLEVLASRCLSLIFGASLQAFATVLMSFILGIGLGSAVVASPRFRKLKHETTAIVLLLVAAGLIGLLVLTIEQWVELYRVAKNGLARNSMGYRYHQILTAFVSLVVLGLPAGLLGAVLPLCIRAVSGGEESLGGRVGRLLTWNTLGAVVGVLLTGFVLMPHLGLRGSFATLAAGLCLAALLAARSKQHRAAMLVSAVGAVALATIGLTGGDGWRYVLSSGMFRFRENEASRASLEQRRQHIKLLFYEDAADATVTVEQADTNGGTNQISLRINGKVDATTRGDLATQYLLAHLPLLARPEAKQVFVLGFGSGITAGAVLGHPIEQLTIAENCEPVVRAGKFFEPWNRGVLTNPRARIWNEDARTLLKLSPQKYDVIISEPSNPWMVGVGSVFSQEFYRLAGSRLTEGGVMAQWFHLYEMHDGIVALVLNTFRSVFPYMEVWDADKGDIILLGSMRPWAATPEEYRKVFARPAPRQDLEEIGLKTPETIWVRQLASQRTGFAIADENAALQSDEFPVLEYEAPRAFYLGKGSPLLFQYDERIPQVELAPADKRSGLGRLDKDLLRSVFAQFSTINPELQNQLAVRLNPNLSPARLEMYLAENPLPSIFFPATGTGTNQVRPPVGASAELQRLFEAESLLRNPIRWSEGVALIETVLRARQSKSGPAVLDWSPQAAAALAAKTALKQGAVQSAKNVLLLGMQLEPEAAELRYLARIVAREERPGTPLHNARRP